MDPCYRLWIRWADNDANIGPTRLYARDALDRGEVWVGWARVPQASAFLEREEAKRAIARHYGPKRKREVAQEAGSALRFFGMPPGSLVVVPTAEHELAVVEVEGERPRRRARDGVWARRVTIRREGIPRTEASPRLRRLISVPHTCLDITKARQAVLALL